jgi:hypothetical protein
MAHEFIPVVTDALPARKQTHLLPRLRQQNRRTQNQKRDPHDGEEHEQPFLTEAPASFRDVLKYPVVTDADCEKMRQILRRDHRAIRSSSGPVILVRILIRTLSDALSTQPKHVCEHEEEK